MRSLSQLLRDVQQEITNTKESNSHISIATLMELLHERGFGVMMILFAIPGGIPGCPPPLPSIVAMPMCFLAAQMILAYHVPKLPAFVGKKRFKISALNKTIDLSMRYILMLEKLIKPRLEWVTTKKAERFHGFTMLIFSISVLIPLPLTNTVPSIANIIIGIGLLSRDGLAIIIGSLIGYSWMVVLYFLSSELIKAAMQMIN